MEKIFGLASYDLLFYLGIGVMSISIILLIVYLIFYRDAGKRLQKKLDREYGVPEKYNRENRRERI